MFDVDGRQMEPEEYIRDDESAPAATPILMDHFEPHRGHIVKVNFSAGGSIVGTLIEIDESWIVVQNRDGYKIDVKKKGVEAIGDIQPRERY